MLTKAVFAALVLTYPTVPYTYPPDDMLQFGISVEQVKEQRAFALEYVNYLKENRWRYLYQQEDWSTALEEAKELADVWYHLRWACDGTERAWHQRELARRIGPDAFMAGRMPPCVPLGRFQER